MAHPVHLHSGWWPRPCSPRAPEEEGWFFFPRVLLDSAKSAHETHQDGVSDLSSFVNREWATTSENHVYTPRKAFGPHWQAAVAADGGVVEKYRLLLFPGKRKAFCPHGVVIEMKREKIGLVHHHPRRRRPRLRQPQGHGCQY